jgi:hypothetical protein
MSSRWEVVMYPHGFASEVAVVGNVKTPLEGQSPVLIVSVGKAVPNRRVV